MGVETWMDYNNNYDFKYAFCVELEDFIMFEYYYICFFNLFLFIGMYMSGKLKVSENHFCR